MIVRKQGTGFSVVEIVIAIVLVAVIVLLGWKAWESYSLNDSEQASPTSSQVESNSEDAPSVNDESDLDKAEASLDAAQIDDAESAKFDAETNF